MAESGAADPPVRDERPHRDVFLADVLAGLAATPKTLPCKYLYDARGSELFDRICELEEYYPTRTELAILRAHAAAIARRLGPRALLVEYGTGSARKTRILLDALEDPVAYVPVDISGEHLARSAAALDRRHPELEVLPVAADFTAAFTLPQPRREPGRRVAFFPGSTIGNFAGADARAMLSSIARTCGPGGGLLIGADLDKDPAVLERAYDDAAGVTAAFNRNLLARIDRELDADFDLDRFRHEARYDRERLRIEMRLVSTVDHTVRIDGHAIRFAAGEPIITEHSHKYTLGGFAALARSAGWEVVEVWTDEREWFSVQYLQAIGG